MLVRELLTAYVRFVPEADLQGCKVHPNHSQCIFQAFGKTPLRPNFSLSKVGWVLE